MPLLNVNLDLDPSYNQMINEILQVLTILLVIQFMCSWCYPDGKIFNNLLTSGFLNDGCLSILIFAILGIMTYHLVISNLIVISY